MPELAILGGKPARTKPFGSSAIIDHDEWNYLKKVLERREISRFMGSPTKDIDSLLVMPSLEAENYEKGYFSFLGGRMVRKFEADFAGKFSVKYAISVNSATSGLSVALGAAGIGPGDEVITTCMSFNATAASILLFNSIPVFVDVSTKNFCMDPEKVAKAITPKTKAILVVHLLGNPADMDAILKIARKNNLVVVEDCAQAPGVKYKGRNVGTIGDLGVFSFQETKNIMTGEGGMIITNDKELAKRSRLIRNHGESIPDKTWDEEDLVNLVGMNFRMTELTAALGIAQLKKLDSHNRMRINNAAILTRGLKGLPGITLPELVPGAVPHIFAMLYNEEATGVERSKILASLRAEGIPVGSGYLRTMYENPIFAKRIAYGKDKCPWSCHLYGAERKYQQGDCPVAEGLLRKRFIWFYHFHKPNGASDMKDVIAAFRKVFGNLEVLKKKKVNAEIGYKW
ncbi:MAG: DegT/DnrJ/EryC1/StrS family aminotransferase [Candidatus Omnitrophica bacterium]|nr:DegT/DnrJ/EryC1/StrS family aminotransferase [Candidatus Omnitrophota bacterium]